MSRPVIVGQQDLFRQEGVKALGPAGGQHTSAQVLLINGRKPGRYVAKCYLAECPYMMVAEVVCADLASRLGLPIPHRARIEYGENVWLGFQWMAEDYKPVTADMLDKLVDPGVIPSILAFDVLICNWDGDEEKNMILQKVSPTMDMYQLFIIDHSVALGGNRDDIGAWLAEDKPTEHYLSKPAQLLRRIESMEDFQPFLSKLEGLKPEEISTIVECVPREWRPRHEDTTELLSGFLVRRAAEVGELLRDASDCFPSICA